MAAEHMEAKHSKRTGRERIWRLMPYILLALIIIFDLAYAIAFATGPTSLSEDDAYVGLAFGVLHHQFSFQSIDTGRVLEYLPIAAFFALFGTNVYTSTAWNIIMFLGSVLIAFLLGKEVYNKKAGLLSALLLSFFIPTVNGATRVEINEAMMFFSAMALLALLYGRNKKSWKWMLASGILLVAGMLTTPIALYAIVLALLFVAVELARGKMTLRALGSMVAGMAIAAIAIMALSYATSGNPMVLVSLNQEYYSNLTMTQTTYGIIGAPVPYASGSMNYLNYYIYYYPQKMLHYYSMQGLVSRLTSNNWNTTGLFRQVTNRDSAAGFYFYAAMIAAAYLLVRRDRRLYYPALWLGVGFLFIQFAPQGLTLQPFRWILIFRDVRYLASIAVPTSVIIAMALARMMETKARHRAALRSGNAGSHAFELSKLLFAAAAIVFLIATSVPVNLSWSSYIYTEYYSLHAIANMFAPATNNVTIWYPSGDYPRIQLYVDGNSHVTLLMLDGIPNCSTFAVGSYVIIPNATAGYSPRWPYINDTAKYCPNLKLVASPYDSNATDGLVHLAEEYEQRLYYVPETAYIN